jgi:8-oxo-dGTP pyrophosphatase MutT (NUDIX family)
MRDPIRKRKAFAYITSGPRLLLLAQPDHPDAGIQVPAGTARPGEPIIAAALREAAEETGLVDLALAGVLGERSVDMRAHGRNEIHDRTFVHIRCHQDTPDTWDHWETDPDGAPGTRFRFTLFWASLDARLPALIGGHDALVSRLRQAMS